MYVGALFSCYQGLITIDHRGGTPSIRQLAQVIYVHLPPRNFITLHYAYFIGTCLVTSLIFWGSSTPSKSISYTDSLFVVVSAMTLAGLNTINLSELNTFQQFLLFVLILLGSAIFVSIAVVHVRRKAFEQRFKNAVKSQRRQPRERRYLSNRASFGSSHAPELVPVVDGVEVGGSETHSLNQAGDEADEAVRGDHSPTKRKQWMIDEFPLEPEYEMDQMEQGNSAIDSNNERDPSFVADAPTRRITFAHPNSPIRARELARVISMQGIGLRQDIVNNSSQNSHMSNRTPSFSDTDVNIGDRRGRLDFLSPASFIGRNSQFSSLTPAERDRLGGVEYRAITLLAFIVPLYYILWQLLGSIGLGAYIAKNRADTTRINGLNPWYAILISSSVFDN